MSEPKPTDILTGHSIEDTPKFSTSDNLKIAVADMKSLAREMGVTLDQAIQIHRNMILEASAYTLSFIDHHVKGIDIELSTRNQRGPN